MAYRLIAQDTVEEKTLELHASKKSLAESMISADEGLIKKLTFEDLNVLLS